MVLAIYDLANFGGGVIRVLSPDGNQMMFTDISTGIVSKPESATFAIPLVFDQPTWNTLVIPFNVLVLIPKPGTYPVILEKGGVTAQIGLLHFVHLPAPLLTEERRAAIKADPHAVKSVRLQVACNKCGDKLQIYAGLDKLTELEKEGWKWYEDIPDSFNCGCGEHKFDLTSYRENFQGLVGVDAVPGEINFIRLYENDVLQQISIAFESLLDSGPPEESVQNFIETNPILLHQFTPDKVFFKTPILSKFKTDITILTKSKQLILVEIEKPSTLLMKSDGGIAAELQHALTQVTDWLFECENHRLAVLSCLGLNAADVSAIKGVVIAGRDKPYEAKHLLKLKWQDFGRVTILTYDDILAGVTALARTLRNV
jgi:hypothetical protein